MNANVIFITHLVVVVPLSVYTHLHMRKGNLRYGIFYAHSFFLSFVRRFFIFLPFIPKFYLINDFIKSTAFDNLLNSICNLIFCVWLDDFSCKKCFDCFDYFCITILEFFSFNKISIWILFRSYVQNKNWYNRIGKPFYAARSYHILWKYQLVLLILK